MLAGDEPINRMHIDVDNDGRQPAALYQPPPTSSIVAAVKINSDLERVATWQSRRRGVRGISTRAVKQLIDIPPWNHRAADDARSLMRWQTDIDLRAPWMKSERGWMVKNRCFASADLQRRTWSDRAGARLILVSRHLDASAITPPTSPKT